LIYIYLYIYVYGTAQTMAERSRVFDDQSDYYSNTDWLSHEEKEVSWLGWVGWGC
jgi:hypothetical protein